MQHCNYMQNGNHQVNQITEATYTWSPPQQGYLKCNVDAAFYNNISNFGIGIYFKNDRGEFFCAKITLYNGLQSVIEAISRALRFHAPSQFFNYVPLLYSWVNYQWKFMILCVSKKKRCWIIAYYMQFSILMKTLIRYPYFLSDNSKYISSLTFMQSCLVF